MNIEWGQYVFKISLIIKNNPYDDDDFNGGTHKLDFENSFYRILDNNMVIETRKDDTIIGQVFDLKTIKSYKIWQ